MITKKELSLIIALSNDGGYRYGENDDAQIRKLINNGYISGNAELTEKGQLVVSSALDAINSNVLIEIETKSGQKFSVAGIVNFDSDELHVMYTYRPTGPRSLKVGSLLKSDIKNIGIVGLIPSPMNEIMFNRELRELIDIVGDGSTKFASDEEATKFGKIIVADDDIAAAEADGNAKTRVLNDEEIAKINILKNSDIKFAFDVSTFEAAKWIMVKTGYWVKSGDFMFDYLPGSTEIKCIDDICRLLKFERKHKGIGPW